MKKGIWSGRSICHYGKKNPQIICECGYKKESLLKRGIISESDAEMDQRANAAVQSALTGQKFVKSLLQNMTQQLKKHILSMEME